MPYNVEECAVRIWNRIRRHYAIKTLFSCMQLSVVENDLRRLHRFVHDLLKYFIFPN